MRTRRVGAVLGVLAVVAVMAVPGSAREVSNSGDSGVMVSASFDGQDSQGEAWLSTNDAGTWSWAGIHFDGPPGGNCFGGISIHGDADTPADFSLTVEPVKGKDKLTLGEGSATIWLSFDCGGMFHFEGSAVLTIDMDGTDGDFGKASNASSWQFPGTSNSHDRYTATFRSAVGSVVLDQFEGEFDPAEAVVGDAGFGSDLNFDSVPGSIHDWSAWSHHNSH